MVFNFDAVGFILGIGYVMGLRIALIFCAGGILVNFVLVPLIWFIGSHMGDVTVYPATMPISHMAASDIYRNYVRLIAVGAIATAGLAGLLKSLRVITGSFGIALHAFRHGEAPQMERTDRDIPIVTILLGVVAGTIAVAAFFGLLHVSWTVVAVGLALTLLFSFFFTTVAANAIATTANNPASGMTLLTVIVSAVVLAEVRTLRHHRHVLRDGPGRHGLCRPVRLRPVHYRSESRLLDRFHSFRAGEGEVHRRRRVGDHRGVNHRPARQGLPVWRSSCPATCVRSWSRPKPPL